MQGACQVAPLQPALVHPGDLLAPAWHTRLLVALMLVVTALGALGDHAALPSAPATSLILSRYFPLALVNLGLCLYVGGVGLRHNVFARLLHEEAYGRRRLQADVLWAGGLTVALISAEFVLQALLGLPESIAAHALMPARIGEKIVWVFVAAVIGFAEELAFRGYLQRQLGSLFGWLPFGVLGQALLFGMAHGEQGGWAVARFALYALGLGWVAAARRSLVPGVVSHVALDWVAGLSG